MYGECAERAIDSDGNPVTFYSESFSGGIKAVRLIANFEITDADIRCFIDDHECIGVELRLGGAAAQILTN